MGGGLGWGDDTRRERPPTLDAVAEELRALGALLGCKECADHEAAAVRREPKLVRAVAGIVEVDPKPVGLERPGPGPAVRACLHDLECLRVEPYPFTFARAPVAPPERHVDKEHVEPEKREDGPRPQRGEDDSDGEAERRDGPHEQTETGRSKRAVRQEYGVEEDRSLVDGKCLDWCHDGRIGEFRPRGRDLPQFPGTAPNHFSPRTSELFCSFAG